MFGNKALVGEERDGERDKDKDDEDLEGKKKVQDSEDLDEHIEVKEGDQAKEQQEDRTTETPKQDTPEKPKKTGWLQAAFGNIDVLSLIQQGQDIMAEANKNNTASNGDGGEISSNGGEALDKKALKAVQDKDIQALDKLDIPADKKQLMQALAASQTATGLLAKASALKDKAQKCLNPAERQRMLQEAYDKEVQAHGQSKWAKRMQSGVWQGGAGGAGIGGGIGAGLGTVVGTLTGTLVGGVVSLPTTALGGLVGMGVGGITGPFIKLDQTKAKQVMEREKAKGKSDKEVEEAIRKEAVIEEVDEEATGDGAQGQGQSSPGAAISQPESGSARKNLERQKSSQQQQQQSQKHPTAGGDGQQKKKPRKLEVRSGGKAGATTSVNKENTPSKKGP
jgi:hypothetical protein